MKNTFYPELDHPVSDLSAYSLSLDVFIISLKSDEIIRFQPADVEHFRQWLKWYNVRNVDED